MLIFQSKYCPAPLLDQLQVAISSVTSSAYAKNIGVVIPLTLSLDKHITQICKSLFSSIRNISHIRKFLRPQRSKILVHVLVPVLALWTPQEIITASATCFEFCSILLFQLHWLPVEQHIEFQVLLFTYKVMQGMASQYSSVLLEPYSPLHSL